MLLAAGTHRQQPVAFVSHYDIVVLIYYLHTAVAEHTELTCEIDLYYVAGIERGIMLGGYLSVDQYLVVFEHLFYRGALLVGQDTDQVAEQLQRFLRLCAGVVGHCECPDYVGSVSVLVGAGAVCEFLFQCAYAGDYYVLLREVYFLRDAVRLAGFFGLSACDAMISRHSSMVRAEGSDTVLGSL